MPTRPSQNDPERVAQWEYWREVVGANIRKQRLKAGFSQEELAFVPAPRGRRVDVASLACLVRRDEGQRGEAAQELEAENARLKKLVANQALDIDMLKDLSADAPIDVKC